MKCPRCGNVLMGTAWTCLVHGDQRDVGNREPVLESVRDQRQARQHDPAGEPEDVSTPRRGL